METFDCVEKKNSRKCLPWKVCLPALPQSKQFFFLFVVY